MNARGVRPAGPVFLDTHGLVAALNADDLHHAETSRLLSLLAGEEIRAFTSDWVLAEFLSITSRRAWRVGGGRIVEGLRASTPTTVVEARRSDWERAYRLFRTRKDKEWSFVDCTSIVLCGDLGIAEVLTHDHHFVQTGLRVLLP